MSVRAVIISVVGAIFIAAVGYYSDQVARLNHFVGNFLPIIVYFPLIVGMGLINPLLGRIRGKWAFGAGETGVIVALLLVSCNIPGSGLLRMWSRNCVMPVHANKKRTSWQHAEVLKYVPSYMLANDGQYDEDFIQGITGGQKKEKTHIGLDKVPWSKWAGPLTFWMPVVVLFAVASICLALIVHRTWAEHERLPYPIAQMTASLMGADRNQHGGSIFRNKLFLIGAGLVFALHVVNGFHTWTRGRSIQIPMGFNFWHFYHKFEIIRKVPYGTTVCGPTIWPSMVALACLTATDVSFSLGIAPFVWLFVGYWLMTSGVRLQGFAIEGNVIAWQTAGSSIAVTLILMYIGRRFYSLLLRGSLGLRTTGEVRGYEVWACRFFFISMAGLAVLLVYTGMAWPVAILALFLFMLAHLIFARINAESGLFLIQSQWQTVGVLLGIFGAEALGLRSIAVVGMLGVLYSIDKRECLMPMVINGLRTCDLAKVRTGRVGAAGVGIFLVALVAAVPFSLWVDHNWGLFRGEGWSTHAAPHSTFGLVEKKQAILAPSGALVETADLTPMQRLGRAAPGKRFLIALIAGAGAALLLYWLRIKYTWWPLHPIMLIVWCTWAMIHFWFSFLLGCAIKKGAARLGVKYADLRTFMIGVLVGDLSGGALWMIVGAIQYAATGKTPPRYHIFPGG